MDAKCHKEDELAHISIGCTIEVHKALGSGVLESGYVNYLVHELSQRGLLVEREIPIPHKQNAET